MRQLAWLSSYAQGRKTHEECAKSAVPFDRKRAANVYFLAARFDPAYLPLALELRPPAWAQALYAR